MVPLLVAFTASAGALAGLGMKALSEGAPPTSLPFPLPMPPGMTPAPPPPPPFPDMSDPVAYCRTWLEQPPGPHVTVIADTNRTLRVERFQAREASLSKENALLLKSLGWNPEISPLDAVMDVNETDRARCTLTQRVNLSRENALAWLAMSAPPLPADARGLADVTLVAEVARTTVHAFDLDPEEVVAVLALGGGERDPRILLSVADVETRTNESASLVQRVELEGGDVLVSQALTGSAAPWTRATQGPQGTQAPRVT